MVPYSILEYHDLQHLLHFGMGKPAWCDDVGDALDSACIPSPGCCLMSEIGLFIPMGSKMFLRLYGSPDSI